MTTKTTTNNDRIQLRGLCAACGNCQAVRKGRLAQHGYQRPEWAGGNVGACAGSGRQPHEVSLDLARDVAVSLSGALDEQKARLAQAVAGPEFVTVMRMDHQTGYRMPKRVTSADVRGYEWAGLVRNEIWMAEQAISGIKSAQERVAALLTDWQPKALTEVVIKEKAQRSA